MLLLGRLSCDLYTWIKTMTAVYDIVADSDMRINHKPSGADEMWMNENDIGFTSSIGGGSITGVSIRADFSAGCGYSLACDLLVDAGG